MIPYASFLYFGALLYVVVPAALLGLAGREPRLWISLATLAMLAVQYGGGVQAWPGTELREIWLVAATASFQWALAWGFLRLRARVNSRWAFYAAVLLTLVPLVAAKWTAMGAPGFHLGFLGISYVTLRSLDVVFCIQDRLVRSLPPLQLLTYLLFFGTISSGPIDRYRRFETDWARRRTRAEVLDDLDAATHRFFLGFFYKFILAALVQEHWLEPAAVREDPLGTLSYMYAYTFHLFFDFAGYSAFAVAVSYVFGVHTPENFHRPFLARNIRDFWNRWHITLSWWLRDHVYMRFVMAAMKGRWFRSKFLASYLGLLLAFGLMGLWHGAETHFLLYGLYHGCLLSAYEAFSRWNNRRRLWGDGPLWQAAGILATFHCVCFGFLLFSGRLTGADATQRPATDLGAFEGRVEQANCEEIGGWAWDARKPQQAAAVEIRADGVLLATVIADLVRPDLAASGKGSGAHAFVFVPPARLKDGRPHSLTATIAGSGFELIQEPRSIVCVQSGAPMDGLEGSHDASGCGFITGWAWDATQPDRAVSVDLYCDEVLVGTVAADRYRATLQREGYGNGRHGFAFATPPGWKDGLPHTIAIRLAGGSAVLRGSPQLLRCSAGDTEPEPEWDNDTFAAPPGAHPYDPDAPRSYADGGNATIVDRVTGLTWERKIGLDGIADANNLHDADNCYPWAGACAVGEAQCLRDRDCGQDGPCIADDCQAPSSKGWTIFEWIDAVNAERFAGHGDWRIPNSTELYSIVNPLEHGDKHANAAFHGARCGSECADPANPDCGCTNAGVYWAAPAAAPSPDSSWMMYFYCNGHLFLDLRSNRFYARAVRGAPAAR